LADFIDPDERSRIAGRDGSRIRDPASRVGVGPDEDIVGELAVALSATVVQQGIDLGRREAASGQARGGKDLRAPDPAHFARERSARGKSLHQPCGGVCSDKEMGLPTHRHV
jgi:hypothetical protein